MKKEVTIPKYRIGQEIIYEHSLNYRTSYYIGIIETAKFDPYIDNQWKYEIKGYNYLISEDKIKLLAPHISNE